MLLKINIKTTHQELGIKISDNTVFWKPIHEEYWKPCTVNALNFLVDVGNKNIIVGRDEFNQVTYTFLLLNDFNKFLERID